MIGEKKQRVTDTFVPRTGIQQPVSSPEEIRIQRMFESCLFKSSMSCVIGASAAQTAVFIFI